MVAGLLNLRELLRVAHPHREFQEEALRAAFARVICLNTTSAEASSVITTIVIIDVPIAVIVIPIAIVIISLNSTSAVRVPESHDPHGASSTWLVTSLGPNVPVTIRPCAFRANVLLLSTWQSSDSSSCVNASHCPL